MKAAQGQCGVSINKNAKPAASRTTRDEGVRVWVVLILVNARASRHVRWIAAGKKKPGSINGRRIRDRAASQLMVCRW